MATFIPGIMCAICERPIHSRSEAVAFPPFVANEADPLFIFSDSVVHADEFRAHPLAPEVNARLAEALERTQPAHRVCKICGERVANPDDYLGLGHLVEDAEHPLYQFNYGHFHRSCLLNWRDLKQLVAELQALDSSGAWKGESLRKAIATLLQIAARARVEGSG